MTTNANAASSIMELIDAYAESRHVNGAPHYNARTAEARAAVAAALASPGAADLCDHCQGSGEQQHMTQHLGPDDYEVTGPCRKCEGSGAASPGAVAAPDSTADAACILSQVCDLFHIGKLARTESTILTNVRNVIRFTGLLRAVERDLFPEPDLPEDEDDDPYTLADEGLPVPNSWGARDGADYVAQFRAALAARGAILAAEGAVAAEPTGWQPIETAPKDGTLIVVKGDNHGDSDLGQHHCIASWFKGCWMESSDWNPTSDLAYLTHWMPLPPAPKE